MVHFNEMSDAKILKELGRRLKQKRLNQNFSQDALAKKSGLSRRSIYLVESGHSVGLSVMIRILRTLRSLDGLDAFLPVEDVSPVEFIKLKGVVRKRASKKRGVSV